MSIFRQTDNPIQIRLATLADAPTIAAILHQAFAEFEPVYTPGGFAATTPTAEQIEARWDEGPVWIALLDGKIVGTVAAVPKGDALYVRSMAVLPEARGHHIGEQLLEQIENYAHERDIVRLFLSTTPFLDRAIRLYENYGFQRKSTGPQDLFGTPIFSMEKFLSSKDMDNSDKYRDVYLETMQRGYAAKIKSKDDAGQLQAGLADLVKNSKYADHRDQLMTLVGLWLASAYAGIDPNPYFQAAAQTADSSDPYGTGSAKDMLINFHNYAIFKEGVEPFLPGA